MVKYITKYNIYWHSQSGILYYNDNNRKHNINYNSIMRICFLYQIMQIKIATNCVLCENEIV